MPVRSSVPRAFLLCTILSDLTDLSSVMNDSDLAREKRVAAIRERLRKKVPKGKRRWASREIGVSNTALGDFIDGKTGPPQDETLDRYEAWLDGVLVRPDSSTMNGGGLDLPRQIDAVLALEAPYPMKAWLIAEIGAAYRSRWGDRAEEGSVVRAEVMLEMEKNMAARTDIIRTGRPVDWDTHAAEVTSLDGDDATTAGRNQK